MSTRIALTLLSALAASLSTLRSVTAHGTVKAITVDDVYYAGYAPSAPSSLGLSPECKGNNSDSGFVNYNAEYLAMNGPDGIGADFHAPVKAGSKITWFWTTWPDSHIGPITTHMAACPAAGCDGFDGNTADNWFNVGYYGYDTSGMWATQYLIADNAYAWEFTMPSDLPPGPYLLRHELWGMHSNPMPQLYPIVMWIDLTSDGTVAPTPTGSFPAMYAGNSALNFSLYYAAPGDPILFSDPTKFVMPGVAYYNADAAGDNGPAANGTVAPTGTPVTVGAALSGGGSAAANDTVAAVTSDSSSVVVTAAGNSTAILASASATGLKTNATETASAIVSALSSVVDSTASSSTLGATGASTYAYGSQSSSLSATVLASGGIIASPTAMTSLAASGSCKARSTVTVTVTEA